VTEPLLGLLMQYHFAIRDDLVVGIKDKTLTKKTLPFNITPLSADAKVKLA
jgi:hypothetical protein